MNPTLKEFVRREDPSAKKTKKDLFSCFMERSYDMVKKEGSIAMVTLHN